MAFKNLNCTVEVSGLEDTGADAASERLIEILGFLLRTLRPRPLQKLVFPNQCSGLNLLDADGLQSQPVKHGHVSLRTHHHPIVVGHEDGLEQTVENQFVLVL